MDLLKAEGLVVVVVGRGAFVKRVGGGQPDAQPGADAGGGG